MLKEAGIQTEPQKKNSLVRTTVYGEPCLIFHRSKAEETPLFIGKYNFNTDKSAENTFGFAEGDELWKRDLFRVFVFHWWGEVGRSPP